MRPTSHGPRIIKGGGDSAEIYVLHEINNRWRGNCSNEGAAVQEGGSEGWEGRGQGVDSTILAREDTERPRAGTGAMCLGRKARASILRLCERLRGLSMWAAMACCCAGKR